MPSNILKPSRGFVNVDAFMANYLEMFTVYALLVVFLFISFLAFRPHKLAQLDIPVFGEETIDLEKRTQQYYLGYRATLTKDFVEVCSHKRLRTLPSSLDYF